MYSVYSFGRMIADPVRAPAYESAMRKAIQPGAIVVDLGAGTGAFSLLACRLGAGHVYAIESNPVVAIARESAEANGYADRITVLDRFSTAVTLPEKADVLVSDLRGTMPLFSQHIPSIVDARTRLLREDGIQIPERDELWVGLVHDEVAWREVSEPWTAFDLDMSAGRRYAVNSMQSRRVKPDRLVLEPRRWATLDYRTITRPSVAGTAEWNVDKPSTIDGLCLWFTAHLMDGISYSTSPRDEETVYGATFMPLAEVVELASGDAVAVRLRADLVAGTYIWTWITEVRGDGGVRTMRQSSFMAAPPPLIGLAERSEIASPEPSDRGRAAAAALQLLDGRNTLGFIADELVGGFPKVFTARAAALRFVADLAEQYATWGPVSDA